MTSARRPLDRKACPRCGRTVAWRVVRGPRVNRGRYGAIPAMTQPVMHRRPLVEPNGEWALLGRWCEPQRGPR